MTIKSNTEFINEKINVIGKTLISNTDKPGKDSYESTSQCPSSEPTVIDIFLSHCSELYAKISNDMAAISEVGEGWETMDNIMEGYAAELNMEVTSVPFAEVPVQSFGDKSNVIKDSDNIYNSVNGTVNGNKTGEPKSSNPAGGGGTDNNGKHSEGRSSDSITQGSPQTGGTTSTYQPDIGDNNGKHADNQESDSVQYRKPEVESKSSSGTNKNGDTIIRTPRSNNNETIHNTSEIVKDSLIDTVESIVNKEVTVNKGKPNILGAAAIIGGAGLSGTSLYEAKKKEKEKKKKDGELIDESIKF